MSSIRRVYPTHTWSMRRISGLTEIWIPKPTASDHCSCVFVLCILKATSDHPILKRVFQLRKQALWYTIRLFIQRDHFPPSDNPIPQWVFSPCKHALWYMLLLKIRPLLLQGRIIRVLWYVYPTLVLRIIRTHWIFPVSDFWLEVGLSVNSFCFFEFHSMFWVDLEQVCMKSKANSLDDQATNFEPPLIVRSWTKNYKT